MLNIPETYCAPISPRQFELFVRDYIQELGGGLDHLTVSHDQKLGAADGNYQIDVVARFNALGVNFKVLIECKHHSSPIKRDVVAALYSKMQSLGAQKGIVFSSSGFQSGAQLYAEQHGIALVQVVEEKMIFIRLSVNPPPLSDGEADILGLENFTGIFRIGSAISNLVPGNRGSLKNFILEI